MPQQNQIQLRAMTEQEFSQWREAAEITYAAEKKKTGLSEEEAKAVATKSFQSLLPQGLASPGMWIYTLVEASTAAPVGSLWWAEPGPGRNHNAWVYDIILHENARGRGLGRAAMQAGMADIKARGFSEVGLHVFGHNQVARRLYESLGFEATSLVLARQL